MELINVSFTILTHNETVSLKALIDQLLSTKQKTDEIIIVDDFSDNKETIEILEWAKTIVGVSVYYNKLNGNFSEQKNFAASKCINDYIFNIDADELAETKLLESYREILHINPDAEMFLLPRVNKVNGLTLNHVTNWRWNITALPAEIEEESITFDSEKYKLLKTFNLIIENNNGVIKYNTPIINWPDFQSRIYKRNDKIIWRNKVHETIVGYTKYARFPADKRFALLHTKDIKKQEKQNELYTEIQRG